MKKTNSWLEHWYVSVVVLLIFVISLVSWVFFAKEVLSESSTEKQEETLVSAGTNDEPDNNESKDQGGSGKIAGICSLFDDAVTKLDTLWSVYKKASLSKVDSIVNYLALGEISSVQVIAGLDRWLFFSSINDGNSLGDFDGSNVFDTRELELIGQSAMTVQNDIEKRGIKFAVLVVPNKENVYSEYMPDKYIHAQVSRTDILIDHLSEIGVKVVSPKNDLLNNRLERPVFYRYDTHWNQLGAYIGVRDVLLTWDIIMPELQEIKIKSKELAGNYHYGAVTDLAKMVGLEAFFSDEIEYEVDGTMTMDWDRFEKEQENGKLSVFHNDKALTSAKLFLVGDSFRSAMVPILTEQFTDVYVIHRSSYSTQMLDEINPDYLVVEYVERYSGLMESINFLVDRTVIPK